MAEFGLSYMQKYARTAALLVSIVLFGCTASGPVFTPAEPEVRDNALIYIYRPGTYFYAANPDVPIIYFDDERLLRLRIGGYTWVSVAPGTHSVEVKDSMLGVPTFSLGEVSVKAETGKTYYLKFTQQSGDILFYGPQVIVTANSKLRPVDETTGAAEIKETKYLEPDQ